jgi:hypothetical protein
VVDLLGILRQAGTKQQVIALLERDPAACASLSKPLRRGLAAG